MKRIHSTFLAMLLVLGLAAAPIPAVTVDAAAPPALELVMNVMPLAAATVDAPAMTEAPAVELPPISTNPADWFNNPLVFAAVIAALVAFIKTHVLKDLDGLRTVLASLAVGALVSALGTLDLPFGIGRWNDRSVPDALMYGLQAAVIASGGWDVIKGLLGLGKSAPAAA